MAGSRVALRASAGRTCFPSYLPSFMRAMSQWDMSLMLETMAPQGAMPAVSS